MSEASPLPFFARPSLDLPAYAELASQRRWVCWRLEQPPGRPKPTKVPYTPLGAKASSTSPRSWSTFEACCALVENPPRPDLRYDGIGYVFAEDAKAPPDQPRVIGIDLDECRDPVTGEVQAWAKAIADRFSSYTEASPSGTGLHIIVRGRLPEDGAKVGDIECYQRGRYFTMTGAHLDPWPDEIVECQEVIDWFWTTHIRPQQAAAPRADAPGTGGAAPTGGGDGEGWRSIVIEPTEFPFDRHEAMLDNDPDYQRTWQRKRADLKDQSMSSYDMALAIRAAQADWSNGEIAELIGAFHKAQGARLDKAERLDYLQRTIWQARQWVEELRAKRAAAEAAAEDGRDYSEDGLALSLGDLWHDDARYVAVWGRWLFWDGTRWGIDERLAHMTGTRKFVQQQAREMVAKVGALDDEKALKAAKQTAKGMRSAKTIAAVASLARSNEELVASPDIWDKDPRLLGTPAGVVDLRTGQLAPAQREAFITKRTSVAPAPPGTRPPLWDTFLARIFRHDLELVAYLQRLAGYAATGLTVEQKLFIAHGEGQNGKRVLFNTLRGILGEYGAAAPGDLLLATSALRHPTELARLRGARLVLMSEVPDNAMWNEPLVKRLTGEDPITARFMQQDFFEYEPDFTPVLQVNEPPRFVKADFALLRRMELIPFAQTITKEEQDEHLFEKLKPEWPAILRWILDGAVAYLKHGLQPPKSVQTATAAYLAKFDLLSGWLDDCCEYGPDAGWTSTTTLHSHFAGWCSLRGRRAIGSKTMSMLLVEKGFERKSTEKGSGFHIAVVTRGEPGEE